jgi:oligopeptidase A
MNPLLLHTFRIPFDRIRTEHVVPAVRQALADAEAELAELVAPQEERTYANTLQRLDDLAERLERTLGPVSHLVTVVDSPALREAYNTVLPEFSAFYAKLPLNEALWQAVRQFAEGDEARALTGVWQRHLDKTLRGFVRAGADLPPEQKARMEQIQVELSKLHTQFSDNTLDATNAFELHITDPADLAGLPESAVAQARASAQAEGKEGWRFTLQAPSYLPFMQYAENRELRRQMYQAYANRAAGGGVDNRSLIPRILELRRERARLVGYPDFAEYRLAENMVGSAGRAIEFERDLTERTDPFWQREIEDLTAHARELGLDPLQPWDAAWVAERLRKARFDIDDEALRPYFPLASVLEGMFELAHRLFGITVTRREIAEVWHPEVEFFDIHDEHGTHLGSFYADWFPRPSKRGGAWMNSLITGGPRDDGGFEPHLGLIVANFTPPTDDRPALLTHREVETTFHEFGHLLHHCLSRVEVKARAGTNVPRDWVELPSQIMENWCWERDALDLFARHYRTGERIPDELYRRMWQARTFMGASFQMRQLSFGTLDLELHTRFDATAGTDAIRFSQEVMRRFAIRPEFADNCFVCAFTHVFTGGYAAGYYSYLWSEVLDADAFSRFREEGLFNRETGRAYVDAILSRGDSADPAELFREFMGRDPDPEALLRRNLGDDPLVGTPAGAASAAGFGAAMLRPDARPPGAAG